MLLYFISGKCSPATQPLPWFQPVEPRLLQCHLCQPLHQMKLAADKVSPPPTPSPADHKTGLVPVSIALLLSQCLSEGQIKLCVYVNYLLLHN